MPWFFERRTVLFRCGALVFTALCSLSACGAEDAPTSPDASIAIDAGVECAPPNDGLGESCTTNDDCSCGNACAAGSCVVAAACDEAILNWASPVENTDGSCLVDLAGYKLYWSMDAATVMSDHTEDLGLPCVNGMEVPCGPDGFMGTQMLCSHRLTGLGNGTAYIALTAYNIDNIESDPAGPVEKVIECP